VLISLFAVVAGLVAMIVKASTGTIPSWLIIFTSAWAIGAFQLLAVRVVGEYIGKTFKETKHRPRYIISENLLDKKAEAD